MSDQQKLEILGEHVVKMHKEIVRTKAKLKALETMIRRNIPKNKLAAWNAEWKAKAAQFLQEELEIWEKKDPGFAAWIDDRKIEDLTDLE